jgi:multimeric flavodoxin WrbA
MLKVLAFNASPHMENSNTRLILDPFLEELKTEGADIELYYLRKLRINPCQGEFGCWTKTPGKCIQQDDDMKTLLPKIQQADIIVFATPLYVDDMAGPLKNLFDRMLPIIEPFFELREGHCRHPPRQGKPHTKAVLVSNCGFWEMDNFDPLVIHMKAICKNTSWTYAGALLRPHGSTLNYMLRHGYLAQDVVDTAKNAGKELARNGEMNEETLKVVSRELVPLEMYVELVNQGYKKTLERLTQG